MVTLTKIGNEYNALVLEISGLSTDKKPVAIINGRVIINSSTFKEIDTGDKYLYNQESGVWIKDISTASSVSNQEVLTDEEYELLMTALEGGDEV